jgi:hypothetical protein
VDVVGDHLAQALPVGRQQEFCDEPFGHLVDPGIGGGEDRVRAVAPQCGEQPRRVEHRREHAKALPALQHLRKRGIDGGIFLQERRLAEGRRARGSPFVPTGGAQQEGHRTGKRKAQSGR